MKLNSINSSPSFKGMILPQIFIRTSVKEGSALVASGEIKFTNFRQDKLIIEAFRDIMEGDTLFERILNNIKICISGGSTKAIKNGQHNSKINRLEKILQNIMNQPNWAIGEGPKEIALYKDWAYYANKGNPSSTIMIKNLPIEDDSSIPLLVKPLYLS